MVVNIVFVTVQPARLYGLAGVKGAEQVTQRM